MTDAEIERIRLSQMLRLYAVSREMEAATTGDARFIAAADCLRRMAGTLDAVSNDVLAKLATVNHLSEALLSQLIAKRIEQVSSRCRATRMQRSSSRPSSRRWTGTHNARQHMH
jgi:hypothetical protein